VSGQPAQLAREHHWRLRPARRRNTAPRQPLAHLLGHPACRPGLVDQAGRLNVREQFCGNKRVLDQRRRRAHAISEIGRAKCFLRAPTYDRKPYQIVRSQPAAASALAAPTAVRGSRSPRRPAVPQKLLAFTTVRRLIAEGLVLGRTVCFGISASSPEFLGSMRRSPALNSARRDAAPSVRLGPALPVLRRAADRTLFLIDTGSA
jgi:hypothetical protein